MSGIPRGGTLSLLESAFTKNGGRGGAETAASNGAAAQAQAHPSAADLLVFLGAE
jgi:hypothetical protein